MAARQGRTLIHVHPVPVVDVIDGIKYELLPGEPFFFDDGFHAEVFLVHMAWAGVVEVPSFRDRDGVHNDVSTAITEAEIALDRAEWEMVAQYVRAQIEDRISKNAPAMPPGGRVAEIIKRRKIDLGKYGVHPVSADDLGIVTPSREVGTKHLDQVAAQQETIHRLQSQLDALLGRFNEMFPDDTPPTEAELEAPGLEGHPLPSDEQVADAVTAGTGGRGPRKHK